MTTIITAKDVHLKYGDYEALHGINLNFQEKELTALIDYQRFAGNERLQALIADTENRCLHALSDDDLEWVSAAGEPSELREKKDGQKDE